MAMENYAIEDHEWQDITEEFLSSAKQLKMGEMLHRDYFTLLDAMSAIELMDPRIDSAMMLKNHRNQLLNFDQSIKAGLVKVNNLSAEELIGIVDDTYSCLINWFDGHSLAQTVMINLYLHEPERIEDRCLRVFSQAVLKIVNYFDKIVHMAGSIEDEDFLFNKHFNLANQLNDQKVLNSLRDLCQHFEKFLQPEKQAAPTVTANQTNLGKKQSLQKQTQSSEMNHNNETLTSNNQDPPFDKKCLTAILDRLKFTYHLYNCLYNISKNLLKNLTYWDLDSVPEAQLPKIIKLVQLCIQDCDQNLEKCQRHLNAWNSSIDLGIKPKPVDETETNRSEIPSMIMGFAPLTNFRLLPPAYPRMPTLRSRPEMIQYLKELVEKLRKCITISRTFNQRSFEKSLDSIEGCKYLKPNSCVISRSFLQLLYMPKRSSKLLRDELLQSMTEYCEPLIQSMRKDAASSEALESFLRNCSKTFSQVISLYGHNPARQHERYPGMIEAFKILQYYAFGFNSALNDKIAYSWTTYYLARLCVKYMHAGLELELFSPHEYPYVFWYLQDILYWNEREQLELARQYVLESQLNLDEAQRKAMIKKQRKKGQHSTVYHDKCLMSNEAYRYLSGGLFLLTHGLRMQGKIKSPVIDFTSEETTFDRRFSEITSSSVFQSYESTLKRFQKLDLVYGEAFRRFSEAKIIFEMIGEHESSLKVCKTNLVVARILSTNPDSFANRNAEFCFEAHPSLPTVKF